MIRPGVRLLSFAAVILRVFRNVMSRMRVMMCLRDQMEMHMPQVDKKHSRAEAHNPQPDSFRNEEIGALGA